MKKKDNYKIPEEDTSSVKEPEVGYQVSLPLMSREQALQTGMTLQESRRLLFEKIHQDIGYVVQVVNESYLDSEQAEQEMTDDRNAPLRRLLKASAIHALESCKGGEGYTTREVMEEVGKRLAFF